MKRLKWLSPKYRRAQERDMREELAALAEFAEPGELGNLTRVSEETRAAVGFPRLESVVMDFRYAWRSLRRDKAFALVAVFSLAIGIGADVAIFGLMDALLWRQLPVQDAEQLVSFENTARSYFAFTEFGKHAGAVLEDVMASSWVNEIPTDFGTAQVEFVSGNFFQALGVRPVAGRVIRPFDDTLENRAQVAVLSFAYWQKNFDGESSVVGRSIHIKRAKFTIIGIAPEEFFGLSVGEAPDVWVPLTEGPVLLTSPDLLGGKITNNWLKSYGRLRHGVSSEQAEAVLAPLNSEIEITRNQPSNEEERKAILKDSAIRLIPAAKGISQLRNRFSKPLEAVFWMLSAGLLLACVNVVSLQMARSDERSSEFAIRLAIGASRWRVVRQCFVETQLVAMASTALGLLFYIPITNGLVSLMQARLELKPHNELIGFVFLVCAAVTLLAGLLPAFYATNRDPRPNKQVKQGRRRLIRSIGIAQVCLAAIMISATVLFALSLRQLERFDSGVWRERLLEFEVDSASAGYNDKQAVLLDEQLRQRLKAVPGVEAVTYTQDGIYLGRSFNTSFQKDDRSQKKSHGDWDSVGPGFFRTAGTAILAGRDFSEADRAGSAKVVIVNETLAKRCFSKGNPLGRSFFAGESGYRIIGVVRDIESDLRWTPQMWYVAAMQNEEHPFNSSFLVRVARDGGLSLNDVRTVVHGIDPQLTVEKLETADELFSRTIDTDRLLARLGWGFGVLALTLASVGIYGLLSYDVGRRRKEIGVRMAVGATEAGILRLVLGEAGLILGCGLLLGACAAIGLSTAARSLVFGLKANDPRMELGAGLILTVVALAAGWIPARRAAKTDAMAALRAE